jgi:hypothetical protein
LPQAAVNERRNRVQGGTLGDYDHDGRLDLFITNFDDELQPLYHNDGHGSFAYFLSPPRSPQVSLPMWLGEEIL